MKRTLLSFAVFFVFATVSAHPWKPSNYVIVDTDGGIDDMRAISMLLASRDVRVLAITVSPGTLSSDSAYVKVKSMLNSYFHEGIPVGINRDVKFKSPNFENAAVAVWGSSTAIDPLKAPDAVEVILEMVSAESTPIRFISLGGLSTASHILKNEELAKKQIREFIWSADSVNDTKGFNYNIDKSAAKYILEQTDIPVSIVSRADVLSKQFYNNTFIGSILSCGTPYSKKVAGYFSSTTAMSHPFSYTACDEMVPLFVHYPDLFTKKVSGSVAEYTPNDLIGLKEKYLAIISGETVAPNQVIQTIPTDPSFYMEDLHPYVEQIIEKYGRDEWTSGIIASELHRHLGIFAIIGVKMGTRAREYFNTGVDEFTAKTYAGSTPPLSCMNDGIQVSTGATPGHGLLFVNNEPPLSASVDFTYLNRVIRISLKPELEQQISAELREINFIYGLDSNIYWELVRQKTLKYWLEFDRHEIFNIEEL